MKILIIIFFLFSNFSKSEYFQPSANLIGIDCDPHGPFLIDDVNKEAWIIHSDYSDLDVFSLVYKDYPYEIALQTKYSELTPQNVVVAELIYVINKSSLKMKTHIKTVSMNYYKEMSSFNCYEDTDVILEKFKKEKIKEKGRSSKKIIQ